MSTPPPCFGIIPARYESSRFPGKPLVDILGKPMFVRVYERARACPLFAQVVLATDDERIMDAARVWLVMTMPTISPSRVATPAPVPAPDSNSQYSCDWMEKSLARQTL